MIPTFSGPTVYLLFSPIKKKFPQLQEDVEIPHVIEVNHYGAIIDPDAKDPDARDSDVHIDFLKWDNDRSLSTPPLQPTPMSEIIKGRLIFALILSIFILIIYQCFKNEDSKESGMPVGDEVEVANNSPI